MVKHSFYCVKQPEISDSETLCLQHRWYPSAMRSHHKVRILINKTWTLKKENFQGFLSRYIISWAPQMYSMRVQSMFMKHTHAEHAGDRHTVGIYDVMVASFYTNSCQRHCWFHCQSAQQFLVLEFLPGWHLTAFHPHGDGKCFYVRHKTEITKPK